MLRLVLFTILLTNASSYNASNKKIQYYKNLITEGGKNASSYKFPENNDVFKLDSENGLIIDYGTYDFIIVGAGSAGSVIATRLSEITDWTILVLEAGSEENDYSKIPAMAVNLQFSEMNWGYFTTPQTTCCLGMKSQRCFYPRGKAIGGSSSINAMTYARGNRYDFDQWAAQGNPGWSYEEVLPYFIRSENSQVLGDPGFHGKGGPLNVAYSSPAPKILDNFLSANGELGLERLDYNGADQFGASRVQYTTKNGRRHSTGSAFLSVARRKPNLKVITRALATKVVFQGKRASGVMFSKNGKKYLVKAKKEVVLSGGSINTPQLLMLSGIGPKKHLEELGIRLIQNLPVGEGLKDHPTFYGLRFSTNHTDSEDDLTAIIKQYLDGEGPLTRGASSVGLSFIRSNDDSKAPDLEYLLIKADIPSELKGREFNFNDEIVEKYLGKAANNTNVFVLLVLLHPKSTGQVKLKSSDPIDFPEININYFSDPDNHDLNTLHEGIEFVIKLTQTEAFRKINATLQDIPICVDFEKYSEEFWHCTIRHLSSTIYHPVGTTRMGPNPKTSVVNHVLKVHGVNGLRVADCGVIPSTTSGHTNAVAIMIGEKISEQIKSEYGVYFKSSCSVFGM